MEGYTELREVNYKGKITRLKRTYQSHITRGEEPGEIDNGELTVEWDASKTNSIIITKHLMHRDKKYILSMDGREAVDLLEGLGFIKKTLAEHYKEGA